VRNQPLLLDRSFPAQIFLAVILPAGFGFLTGYILGVDEVGYFILQAVGIIGGIGAGFDHVGSDQGFLRGLCGGLLFGVAILVAHSVFSDQAKATIPHPHAILPIFTTLLGGIFGAIGGGLRARSIAKHATTDPQPA
jgi:hypothetical protein